MKSPQISTFSASERLKYTELQVLRSFKGWYIGSLYDMGEPGTRDSEYFLSEDAARVALATGAWQQRWHT